MAGNQKEAEKTERKLRPLYDAVDNGQNKKALQLADKILKKQDDLQCARALKAIAMLRMGRKEEAVSAMKMVLSSHPGDQATLQACTMYFKETADFPKIVQLYADAAVHYPSNQEILTHLFMAYVRVGEYKKQEHTAIQLHKAFPDSGPYYCWRVMSILMQVSDSKSNGKAKELFLPLAERLMDKYFAENDVDSEAEVRLYLMVLSKLDKIEKKLNVLDGLPGQKLKNREELRELQLECLMSLEHWDRASVMLADMIRCTPDQWSYICQYVSCQIKRCRLKRRQGLPPQEEVGGGDEGLSPDQGDDEGALSWNDLTGKEEYLKPLSDVHSVLESLAAKEMEHFQSRNRTRYMVRGPLLGRMELVRQLYADGMHRIPLGLAPIEEMLTDYFKLFGTKACVFDDLCLFLDVFKKIDKDSVMRFLQWVQQLVDSEPVQFDCADEDLKTNISRLTRHSNLLQLQIFLNCLPLDEMQLLDLCHRYHLGGATLGRHLSSTVNHPGDFYAILAAHVLLDRYQASHDMRILWETVLLLERAKNSNPQIQLLLMKLYGMLGACESVTELFKQMAIKHLQMETIGYITMRYIQSMGTFGFANQIYKSTLCFYYNASKEFSEYIIQSYKNGTFTKIEEFVNCRDRLTHSFNFVSTLTEMNTLDMLLSINSISDARDFFSKDWIPKLPCSLKDYVRSLMDNRDFTVFDDWSPSSAKLTDLQVTASFELECLWLRTRLTLVKGVGEAVAMTGGVLTSTTAKSSGDAAALQGTKGCCPPGTNCVGEWPVGGASTGAGEDCLFRGDMSALEEKVEEYESTLKQMDQHMGVLFLRETLKQGSQTRLPVQHPPPCLGYFFLQEGHGHMILKMMRVTVMFARRSSESVEELLKDILRSVETIKCQIQGVPDELRQSLSRSLGSTSADGSKADTSQTGEEEEKEVEPQLDHPYDILTRMQIDLQSYVMLIQSLAYILFFCTVCTELLVPSLKKEGKKKKKKKAAPPTNEPGEAQKHLRNFIAELHRMMSSLCRFFKPLPLPEDEDELALRLKNLYLGTGEGEEPPATTPSVSTKEKEMKARVCKTVLTSYDMSLRDVQGLASSKLDLASALVQRLGGGPVPAATSV